MRENLPTIAIIDPLGKHGGFHYYVSGTARGLAAQGHPVHVYVTAFTGITPGKPFAERVAFGDLYGPTPTAVRAARYFVGLIRALWWSRWAGAEIVILHAFQHDLREMTAIWGARLLGLKVILTVHDIESFGSPRSALTRRLAMAGASALVFQNRFSKAAFERLRAGPTQRSAIIPHGHYVDDYPSPPSREEARRQLGLDADEFIFLFFGNPREEKGLDLLIRALAALRDRPGWRLVTAGKMKPHQEADIRGLVEKTGLGNRVRIDARHIADDEAATYYRAANIVVVPYRRIYESGVTIMAMSLERAALVSDLEPLTNKIVHHRTGLVFASGDETSLAAALHEALGCRGELDDFGREGRLSVLAANDWMQIGAALSALGRALCR